MHSWRSCRRRALRRRRRRASALALALAPLPPCRPRSSGRAPPQRPPAPQLRSAACRSTRDAFMVFREAKTLARTLPPLSKKSEVLMWMQPVWARQQLDAFLLDCYRVQHPFPPAPSKPRSRFISLAVARTAALCRQRPCAVRVAAAAAAAPAPPPPPVSCPPAVLAQAKSHSSPGTACTSTSPTSTSTST